MDMYKLILRARSDISLYFAHDSVKFVVLLRPGSCATTYTSVLPAKSDSDVMFCLQSYQGLIIDRSLVD